MAKLTNHFDLPIIDMKFARTNREAAAKQIVEALEKVGFLFIENVEGLDYDKLYESCLWFFGQPKTVKEAITRKYWNPENSNIFRGYFPVVEGEPSRKEAFEIGHPYDPNDQTITEDTWWYEQSVWPEEDGKFPFKEYWSAMYDLLHEVCMDILRLVAIGIGIPEESFLVLFNDKPLSTFRMLHYPPWEGLPPESAKIEEGKYVTTPDHTDTGFMTLLTTFHYKGLEVLTPDGKWAAIEPRPKTLIMNIGDVFSRMLGGKLKATHHRVIDIGVDRYSVPFFLEPAYDADIGINYMAKFTGEGPEHVPEKFGPWQHYIYKNVKKYFEYRIIPDVKS